MGSDGIFLSLAPLAERELSPQVGAPLCEVAIGLGRIVALYDLLILFAYHNH
jgi:hypothetical protein